MARYRYPNAKATLFKNAVPDLPLNPQTKTTTCTGARENRTVTERGAYKKTTATGGNFTLSSYSLFLYD